MPKKSSSKTTAKPAKSAAKKKTALAPQAALEAAMREFEKLAGRDNMIATGDFNALVESLSGPSPTDGLSSREADRKYQAQELSFEAMEAESDAKARKLAKRALSLDPDCVDALVVLTDLDARTPREMIEGLQKAVAAGERSLGAKFIRESKGHFWLLIETRPYMRAMEQLANSLGNEGISVDAIRIYEKMLDLNPNDNQGVRDALLGLYLEIGDLNGAGRLLKKYKNDASANFAWARVLERFLAGAHDEVTAALKEARRANQHVELYLTGNKPLPMDLPEMYSPGSEEEAALCLNHLSGAWAAHKEAVFWMLDQLAADGVLPVTSHAVPANTRSTSVQ
jgi:tetratricopeptide (TPR) repeat protein